MPVGRVPWQSYTTLEDRPHRAALDAPSERLTGPEDWPWAAYHPVGPLTVPEDASAAGTSTATPSAAVGEATRGGRAGPSVSVTAEMTAEVTAQVAAQVEGAGGRRGT